MHYNNKNNNLECSDRGLAYGDGLFETIAVIDGQLHHWQYHWHRLLLGAERLSLRCPSEKNILSLISFELEMHDKLEGIIKIILTRGSGGRGYCFPEQQHENLIISYHSWPERRADDYLTGIKAIVCTMSLSKQPVLAGIKHLNRLEQVLARNEYDDTEYQEGIMLCYSEINKQYVIEGCSSNIFFVINAVLCTPKIDECGVSGTMRQAIIEFGHEHPSFLVHEGNYDLLQMQQATEVFFSNSIYGILPVASIKLQGSQQYSYHDRSISRVLAEHFNKSLKRPHSFFEEA